MMRSTSKRVRTLGEIFCWPLIINLVCLVGVLAALIGDDWWDVLSWLTLGVPSVWLLLTLTPWSTRFLTWIEASASNRHADGDGRD